MNKMSIIFFFITIVFLQNELSFMNYYKNFIEFEKLNTLSREKVNELFAEYQNIIGQQQSYWKAALDEKNEN